MDETTRLHYLKTMGIESWCSKIAIITNPTTKQTKQTLPIIKTNKKILTPEIKAPLEKPQVNDSWEQLTQEISSCQKCELYKTRTKIVFGTGNIDADWFFIGESTGEVKGLQGKSFIGNTGFLLTEMIRALGLKRENVFITTLLKCPPPDNQDPSADEITTCHDYLRRQQALIKPKIIIAVGRVAAQKLLKTTKPLKELRGVVHRIEKIPLVVIYHPAYLLRSLTQKSAVWQDLQLALKTYQQL